MNPLSRSRHGGTVRVHSCDPRTSRPPTNSCRPCRPLHNRLPPRPSRMGHQPPAAAGRSPRPPPVPDLRHSPRRQRANSGLRTSGRFLPRGGPRAGHAPRVRDLFPPGLPDAGGARRPLQPHTLAALRPARVWMPGLETSPSDRSSPARCGRGNLVRGVDAHPRLPIERAPPHRRHRSGLGSRLYSAGPQGPRGLSRRPPGETPRPSPHPHDLYR